MDPDDFQDDSFHNDVDFDDLAPNTLNELENQARLLASQHLPVANTVPPIERPIHGFTRGNGHIGRPTYPHPPSSDYGFNDEDVIDLDAQSIHNSVDYVTQREQWRPQRNGASTRPNEYQNVRRYAQPQDQNDDHMGATDYATGEYFQRGVGIGQEADEIDVQALRARITELEKDRIGLQKSAEDAKSIALAKAGEISIVRANHDKAAKDFEKRIAVLQGSHAQESAKAKAELETARKDRETVETSNKFLEHDLAQEAERARHVRRSLKDRDGNASTTAQPSPLSTPRKNKALPYRDGFDDDEVAMISPSKFRERSKPTTPKARAKRKRVQSEKAPNDSPRLSFVEPLPRDDGTNFSPDESFNPPQPVLTIQPDQSKEKLELMQRVLKHRRNPDGERSLEILTRYSFPTARECKISAIVYDSLAEMTFNEDFEGYRARFCDSLISIWSQCLAEKYYSPLSDLTGLLQYILMISPASLSTILVARLVPLCQATADLVAVPTAKASKNATFNQGPSPILREQIGPLDYLSILQLIAVNCETQADLQSFWSCMEFDFVLLMLHKAQPTDEMMEMLQLLFTSILDDTFGAIATSSPPSADSAPPNTAMSNRQSKQPKMENDILDRLTVLLFEIPQLTPSSTPHEQETQEHLHHHQPQYQQHHDRVEPDKTNILPTYSTLLRLRTTVLSLLTTLAHTPHGGHSLSNHRLAIPRLVRFLHESILQMYAYFPSSAHGPTTSCVNATVILLAHLDAEFPAASDIRGKLAAVPGGLQRWLVCLSRVAFAEGVGVVEGGLDPGVREVAHRVLDEMLSPEEGEGVLGVFCSGR